MPVASSLRGVGSKKAMILYIKIPIPRLPALLTVPCQYALHLLSTLISYLESFFPIPPDSTSDSLRVSRITFFTHGLACFELNATVQGDTRHTLSIKPTSMADLLKTLTVHPGAGGTVKSVSYDAPPSPGNTTDVDDVDNAGDNRFPRKAIPRTNAITELLKEYIGSPMTVFHTKGSVVGRVMGVQSLQSADTETLPAAGSREDAVVLLQDDGLIVPMRLSQLQGIRVDGPEGEDVAARFQRASDRGRIGVTVVTTGDDERKLKVNYAVEAPVYKVTYRILLLDEHNLYIQAWVIVDNPVDERLDDVEVVITSGLHMSFRHDVYQARFISRPVEPVSKDAGIVAGAVPVAHPHQMLAADHMPHLHDSVVPAASSSFPVPSSNRNEITELLRRQQETIPRWSDAAEVSAAGLVHEYRIPGRVTIPARESALLPLIMATTQGGAVDMYVHDIRATNTLRAAKIVNNTTAPFHRGPVAVYDEDTLVGEGMLPACQPGADVLMPYSVNLQCKVEKRETHGMEGLVRECYISSGQLFMRRYRENETSYDFSEQNEALEVIVVHTRRKDYLGIYGEVLLTKYVNDNTVERTKIMAEKEEGRVYHFRVKIKPKVKTTLLVKESQLVSRTYDASYEASMKFISTIFASITREGLAGKDVLDRMRRSSEVAREVQRVERDICDLRDKAEELKVTQERYRQNMMAAGGGHGRIKDSGLATDYAQRIRKSEIEIEELETKITEKLAAESELRTRFEQVMAEFETNELGKPAEDGEDNLSA